jgi:hypothetical protein
MSKNTPQYQPPKFIHFEPGTFRSIFSQSPSGTSSIWDPGPLNPDPGLLVNPDPDPDIGFDEQFRWENNFMIEKLNIFILRPP